MMKMVLNASSDIQAQFQNNPKVAATPGIAAL
jgi:hypothetical protein